MLEVNTMNFCSFAACPADPRRRSLASDNDRHDENAEEIALLLAVPNTLATEAVDIFHLPSQQRTQTVKPDTGNDRDGMVMDLAMLHQHEKLVLIVGYENGLVAVTREDNPRESWVTLYVSAPHSQPILSLDMSPDRTQFLTCSADAVIARHPIPAHGVPPSSAARPEQPTKMVNTRHAGQQSIRIRDDGRIFATAGWDGSARVYSAKTMQELAVLRWHKTGCYAVAFASVVPGRGKERRGTVAGAACPCLKPPDDEESAALPAPGKTKSSSVSGGHAEVHRGNDGHAESSMEPLGQGSRQLVLRDGPTQLAAPSLSQAAMVKAGGIGIKERREQAAVESHWIAVGSKDGRVSIWEIY